MYTTTRRISRRSAFSGLGAESMGVRNKSFESQNYKEHSRRPNPASQDSFVDIHALYDEVAQRWARDEPKVHDDLIGRPVVVDLARKLGTNRIILDCGCGDGNVCRLVSPFAKTVIGVDFSKQMLAEARKRSAGFENVNYIRARLEDLGEIMKPQSVDLCVALFAVCCIGSVSELRRVFGQIFNVLKDGGFLVAQIPHPLDGLFREPSSWYEDVDKFISYFDSGHLIRRKLRTFEGDSLLVARYHFTLSDYFDSIVSGGFVIRKMLEPTPLPWANHKYPTLSREGRLPSTVIFLGQRPGGGGSHPL